MSHLLRKAAAGGDMAKLKARLDAGDDIESRGKGTGRTALLEASIAGHRDVVALLIEKGADVGVWSGSCLGTG
jgi:ankyrin repeat protein